MGIPPSPPRVTVTLGLGLTSYIRRLSYIQVPQSFQRCSAFTLLIALHRLSQSHIVAADAWSLQNPPYPSLEPFNGTIGCRPVNVELLKDWSSTRQASRKESDRGSNYAQDVVKLHSKHS